MEDGLASLRLLFFPQTSLECFSNNRTQIKATFPRYPLRDFEAFRRKSQGCSPGFGVIHRRIYISIKLYQSMKSRRTRVRS